MIAMNGMAGGAILAVASLVATGCAAQSSAYRQMSAVDHEAAARAASPADAEGHLQAAKLLRDEEQSACYQVPDADRARGPFADADRVSGVEIVRDRGVFPKGPLEPVGVAVSLRAEPGMTQQWLGRVIACQMAHVAVVGHVSGASPLSVANTQVAVSSTATGFRVTVTSRDRDVVRLVLGKGQELADSTGARPSIAGSGTASIQ
jgi:hypothetical protein